MAGFLLLVVDMVLFVTVSAIPDCPLDIDRNNTEC